MGEILYRTKLSEEMFEGLAPWLGWLPGRLMHVNILGCAIFGTVSGSSAATCATIAKVALPELQAPRLRREDLPRLARCGAGTLGILLPPSIIMVVYAVAAEVSIIKVFLAGMLPGFVLIALFSGYIVVWALLNPGKTPREDDAPAASARSCTARATSMPCLVLIVFIVWVMVIGWATATEAAAYGVLGALAIAGGRGGLTRESLLGEPDGRDAPVLHDPVHPRRRELPLAPAWRSPASRARSPSGWRRSQPHKYALIAILAGIYILLGTALDGVSMIVLTTSIVHPDGREGGLRPGLVRHLHRAAGRDRRAHAAARLQHLRAADHDRARLELRGARLAARSSS